MEVKRRIIEYIKYKKISQGKLERLCGLANGYINNIRQSITPEKLQRIARCFPDLNIAWLITGEGQMIKTTETEKLENEHNRFSNPTQTGVPYIDIDFLKIEHGIELRELSPSFNIDFQPYNTVDFWTNISGRSMEPIISSGDIVAIKQINDWKNFILFGEIYAIITDEFRTIKIVTQADTKDKLRLVPINDDPNYCVQDIPINKIVQIFALYGVVKKLM